jgi:hypothetical protein
MTARLVDKVAIVTGASAGIGLATSGRDYPTGLPDGLVHSIQPFRAGLNGQAGFGRQHAGEFRPVI